MKVKELVVHLLQNADLEDEVLIDVPNVDYCDIDYIWNNDDIGVLIKPKIEEEEEK